MLSLSAIPIIFLLQFTIFLASNTLNHASGAVIFQTKDGQEQREFDYFKLALQWPGTICKSTRHCCSSNACCNRSGAFADFTIHGLWPDYNDGTWPACCNGKNFDEKEIRTLLDPLKKYWPSLSCSSPSTCHGSKGSFWAHEKHGTCSYPVARDEYNYFLTTLNVYFKYNVTKVLNDAGYVPSNTEKYPLGGIISAIQNAFRATPSLECRKGAVKELHLCFYKDFKEFEHFPVSMLNDYCIGFLKCSLLLQPRDCAETHSQNVIVSSRSSCPKYVSLPAYEPEARIFDFADSSGQHLSA
ncbi:ribonuclease 2-like [Cucumis melo var. makuwa]|uniref:Ribonuclease 2-like n=1 Tax=Cucumis melo var. makuwa TaxID=1194695 RepID=A0A5A7TKN5_CUCMM|nr:ribonuclease 2-like [Cucumis melo var. makuwa]